MIKIARWIDTKIVIDIDDNMTLEDGNLTANGVLYRDIGNVEIVEAKPQPAEWLGNAFVYDGAWKVVPDRADDVAQHKTDLERLGKPPVPQVVSMRQARLALLDVGLLNVVQAKVAGMTGKEGEAAKIDWEFATEVSRGHGLVLALAPLLGLNDEKLDDLFRLASSKV